MKISLRLSFVLFTLLGLAFTGCVNNSAGTAPKEWTPFEGRVVYIPKYRGFWGIEARKIGKINPIELPREFREQDLWITGEVLLHPDYSSGKKWGTVGEVRNLQRRE